MSSDLFKNKKNSETEKNIKQAFRGESEARNKYTFFAKIAKKEGYEQISDIFLECAENEKKHAKILYEILHEKKDTINNLQEAINGEKYENEVMYKEFEAKANEEGFPEIAEKFKLIGEIEKKHKERFIKLLENINKDEVFKKKQIVLWKCKKCGHIHLGTEAPEECPVCKHSKSYFEIYNNNY